MNYEQVNFEGLAAAEGLTAQESLWMKQLIAVFEDRLENNKLRMTYYEDKNELKNIGLAIPSSFAGKVDTHVGWIAKAVDYLAMRSIFDNFTSADGGSDLLTDILDANSFAVEYQKAVPSELVHGVGFWTVGKGGKGEPSAVICYHNATSSAALWDFRRKRIKCGFVVDDFELVIWEGQETYRPSFVVMHTDYAVIEIERVDGVWRCERKPHMLGQCLMTPMAYRPQDVRPFGKSRVSRACMGITDEMQRQILRASLHAEVYSSGQKAILGVSDEQYDSITGNKYRAAMSELFVATRDENGDVPQISAFQQQSFEPFVAAMESLMSRMAAETAVPVAAFGLTSNGYTSSDALRASSDDLILEAENLNRNNGKALVEVAKLAMAIASNKRIEDLDDNERSIEVHWIDPSMPSAASVADATAKLAGVVPAFGGTDVFWELNGFNVEQRRRVRNEMRQQAARQMFEIIEE